MVLLGFKRKPTRLTTSGVCLVVSNTILFAQILWDPTGSHPLMERGQERPVAPVSPSALSLAEIYLIYKSQQFPQPQGLPKQLQGKSFGQMCQSGPRPGAGTIWDSIEFSLSTGKWLSPSPRHSIFLVSILIKIRYALS